MFLRILIVVAAIAMIAGASTISFSTNRPAMVQTLQSVPAAKVCMVENRVSGRENIAVEVEGKTYYGCCPMCVGKLSFKRSHRYAIDPVTGREVDKAKAYIAAREDGTVVYFESQESAARYSPGKSL
ncbi:MAG TPA: hypothetical protein VII64_00685 [Thermodesulfobacteriota bacterium]